MERIRVAARSGRLVAHIFRPENRERRSPAVLFLHGWTSAQSRYFPLARRLARAGVVAMTVDLYGHGETGGDIGKLTRKEYLEDVLAVYDRFVRLPGVDQSRLSIFGSSFGGYMAALLAGKRKPARLLLRAPANYRNEGFATTPHQKLVLRWRTEAIPWHKRAVAPRGTYALAAINRFRGPVLLIEMGKDEVIPRQTIQNYAHAVPDKRQLTHRVLRGAAHGSPKGAIRRTHDALVVHWLKANETSS